MPPVSDDLDLEPIRAGISMKSLCQSVAGALYLWRAVDSEGEILDILVQARRNKKAALKLMRMLLKKKGFSPASVVTDKLPSYGAALDALGMRAKHVTGGRSNNRAE